MPCRLVEVGAKAAVPDAGLFGDEIGKGLDHHILRLVKVAEVAVQIEGQFGAVAFHKLTQGILVTVEIAVVQGIVRFHFVPSSLRNFSIIIQELTSSFKGKSLR